MTDLISRADAIEAVRGLSVLVDDEDFSYFEDALKALPSADAVSREAHYDAVVNRITDMEERGFVSVVRCKDCRYQEHCHKTVAHTKEHDGFREHWSETIEWCSRGERR